MADSPAKSQPVLKLHLTARHRGIVKALLKPHLPDVEAWVYGSRVNGRSHDGSDLDIVLRGPGLTRIDAVRLADLVEALRDSRLPESFHHEIEREYVVL
jgi:predicted nucleotidyltransferase